MLHLVVTSCAGEVFPCFTHSGAAVSGFSHCVSHLDSHRASSMGILKQYCVVFFFFYAAFVQHWFWSQWEGSLSAGAPDVVTKLP